MRPGFALEGGDVFFVLEGKADVIETFEQAIFTERINFERIPEAL
jgi:hypothetical protein